MELDKEQKPPMSVVDSIIREVYEPVVKEQAKLAQSLNKIFQEKWNALPWYTKRWKRFQGWVYWKRRTVGFWIAGESPDE